MKNIVKLLTLPLFLGIVSCESFLQEEPKDFISLENFPQSRSDAEMMLAGVMSDLYKQDAYDRALFFLLDASADQSDVRANSGPRHEIDSYAFNTDNEFVRNAWLGFFRSINNANTMIATIPNSAMSPEDINRYVSAAKFMRAFSYFHLVRIYGDVPLITEPVQDFTSAKNMERSPVTAVYQLINDDLEEAEQYLPVEWTGMEPGRPDLGTCKTLMAEVFITSAGHPLQDESMWARAAEKAKEVMDMGKYQLLENYGDLWLIANGNSIEEIFSVQGMTQQNNRSMMSISTRPDNVMVAGTGGWGIWHSNETFYNTFDDDDERKEASFLTELSGVTYEGFSNSQPYIKKYFDAGRENIRDNAGRAPNYIKLFRYAEVLLFFAEATNEANGGPTPEAYEAINEVRTRVGLEPLAAGLDQEGFREAVHQERAYELAFEYKRRYDLVRWGKLLEVMGGVEVSRDNIRPHHVLYPVPEQELQINPNLGQNPGY